MILIISNSKDFATIEVTKWIKYLKQNFFVINEINKISSVNVLFKNNVNNTTITLEDNSKFNIAEIKSVWYRRGDLFFIKNPNISIDFGDSNFNETIESFQENETKVLKYFLYDYFKNNCFNLSDFHTANNQNKLIQLSLAQKVKLNVPETLISNDKKDILLFKKKYDKIICKPLSDSVFFYSKDENLKIQGYTKIISNKIINDSVNKCHAMFQIAIDKEYEIRTFFLMNKTYSIVIFSQANIKTKIDYRNYDYKKPNYCSSYILPNDIENKIIKLMKVLNLNNGSIDLIRNKNGEYVFLEVNPVGQFSNVSSIGGYNLEFLIAQKLIKHGLRTKNRKK